MQAHVKHAVKRGVGWCVRFHQTHPQNNHGNVNPALLRPIITLLQCTHDTIFYGHNKVSLDTRIDGVLQPIGRHRKGEITPVQPQFSEGCVVHHR